MSLRNENQLMASMFNRAASVTFDPVIPMQRAQFNPATGSWVFGLAAFAAGVAINKMMHSETSTAPNPPAPGKGAGKDRARVGDSHAVAPSRGLATGQSGSMKDLLHDTMAEESKSGEYINTIGAEVAKLRAEVAALSAQKEQMKEEHVHAVEDAQHGYHAGTAPAFETFRPEPAPADIQKPEFELVRETLSKLNAEKAKLIQTEQELNRVLTEQQHNGANNSALEGKLQQVQAELDALHREQSKIQSQYQETKREANDAHIAMEQLKLMLNEKIAKLHEAEASEVSLRNDHKILMETVESLKGQLEFFRKQASQDQSGVTSLRILEQSNSRLVEQINASRQEAEQQQAALHRLAAEKSELDNKLAQYQEAARTSQARMEQLEGALKQAQNTEQKLLLEVEKLSSNQASIANASVNGRVAQLEAELQSARDSISDLERSENDLIQRLTAAEQSGSDQTPTGNSLFDKIKSERDELKNTLSQAEKRNSDVKTDLVIAAEKEEELSTQISSLLDKISSLENERDLYKSKADVDQLKVTNAQNEYQALKQSILTLESEKISLSTELEEYQRVTKLAQERESQATAKVRESLEKEKNLTDDIARIKAGIESNDDRQREYLGQQKALQQAELEIRSLLDSRVQKDQELESARREMERLDSQLKSLTNQAGLLAQDEQDSSKQVSLIQDQLKHRDNAIAEARVKEEHLKREVEVLQQTSSSLHDEVNRLRAMQQEHSSSSASLDVLRDTEAQLIAQLEQSRNEIRQQHQGLIKSEQDKAQLEIQYREESIKLASLRKENEDLRDKLAQWQSQESAYSNKIAGLSNETEKYQQLQNEYQGILQKQDALVAQSENAYQLEAQLKRSLAERDAQLTQVVNERDSLNKQLLEIRSDLQQVTSERNHLQQTCNQLQTTISDLEAQHKQRESQHKDALNEMESKFQQKLAQREKVIPLTANDAIKSEKTSEPAPKKSTTPFETLDTSMFDEEMMDTEEHQSPVSESLFQSSKVGRLRKFKGHKKTTDIEEKERELDQNKADQNELETAKSATGEISQEEIDAELEQNKAYSPNRSFVDLLEDNERLKKEQKPVDLEAQWSELDELPEEELLEDSGSLKPLLVGGLAAGVAVGCAAYFLFTGKQSDPGIVGGGTLPHTSVEHSAHGANSSQSPSSEGDSEEDIKLLEEKILGVLQDFSAANDFASKAKLTRLPNLSMRDMKIYAASHSQDFKVESVEFAGREKHVEIEFIRAIATVSQDGQETQKVVYLTENPQGELLIDWHTYVHYEVAPWDKFLDLDHDENSQNWSVIAERAPNDYDKFPAEKFESLTVRSSNPDSYGSAVAYLSKSDPMYQQLIDVYNKGQSRSRKFIFRLKHVGDGSRALIVDEVISLSEFYLNDIDPTVSSSYGDIFSGDSSY